MQALHKGRQETPRTSLPCNLRMLRTGEAGLPKLLKEELRMTIMAKRHARGQGHLKLDFPEPKSRELTMAELERRERRREQNRRAAQRCRRKKRMNQISVIQNYEWIMTRNQQLEQELDRLRQEKDQVQALLKAHCQVCTCAHAQTLTRHMLDPAPVKMEPGDDPLPSAQAGFGPHEAPRESWQYKPADGMTAACVGQQAYNSCQNSHPQPRNFPSTSSFTSTASSPSYHTQNNLSCAALSPTGARESSAQTHGAGTPGGPVYSNGRSLTTLVPAVPYTSSSSSSSSTSSSSSCVQPVAHAPVSANAFSVLEELVYMPGGLRSCVFQDEASTPLSADGRRSISSVSSDVSAMSEQPLGGDVTGAPPEESVGLPGGDFYVTDDVTSSDVSQLLSQINQSDLIFQPDGGNLDEVFNDPAVSLNSLPEHFLNL